MIGTSLIGNIINKGTSTVHERYMTGTWTGTWTGTSLIILKYYNTITLEYLNLLKIKILSFLLKILGLNFQKSTTAPGVQISLPAHSRDAVFCRLVNNNSITI